MEEIKKSRSAGIDIIKTIAVLFVLCVHFSFNTYYYDTPVSNANMFVQSCLRWLFYMSVPLFLMCTGYLNYKKTFSRSYCLKIFRIVIPYVLISIICLLVKIYVKGTPITLQNAIHSIFYFSANSYSWYVNMYIGLFLMAPIFNIAINTMDRKKAFRFLLILIFVISLPATFNPIFENIPNLAYIGFPDWWSDFFPIVYYFIGAYISKYQVRIKKPVCIAVVLVIICAQTALQILMGRYECTAWLMTNCSSLFVITGSLFVFLLLYSVDLKFRLVKFVFKWISTLTLEIYLFSNISDSLIYSYFADHVWGTPPSITQEAIFKKYFFIIVPISFLSSLVMAVIFNAVYRLCGAGVGALTKKIKSKKAVSA